LPARSTAFVRPRRSLVIKAASGNGDTDSNPPTMFFADAADTSSNNAEEEKKNEEAARLEQMAADAVKAAEAQMARAHVKANGAVEKAVDKPAEEEEDPAEEEEDPAEVEADLAEVEADLAEKEADPAEKEADPAEKGREAKLDEEAKKLAEEKIEQERIAAEKERQARLEEEIRISEEERQRQLNEFTSNVGEKAQESYEKFIKPLSEIKEGVSADRIKGAAIAATALTLMASKGVVASSAVGLSAAYLSISKTVAGDVMRTVGGITWDVTESATKIAEQMGMGLKTPKFGVVDKTVVNNYKGRKPSTTKSGTDRIDEVELAYIEAEDDEDLARVLRVAESVISEADAAIAKAEQQAKESKAAKPEEVVVEDFIAEDNGEVDENEDEEEVEVEELVAEAQAENKDAEEVIPEPEEDREEVKELKPEPEDEEEEVSEEEEEEEDVVAEAEDTNFVEEEEADEADIFFDDDEFMAAVELAQEGIEGKIVGVDEIITDNSAKAEWDAAGVLANELRQDIETTDSETNVEDDDDDDDDDFDFGDIDMEALGRMARQAVETFESDENIAYEAILDQKREWANSMSEEDEDDEDDVDFEDEDDMFSAADLGELAAAARAAVEASDNNNFPLDDYVSEDVVAEQVVVDWSKLKVIELKSELKKRGLKTTGKKADLVATLEQNDLELLNVDKQIDDEQFLNADDREEDDEEDDDMLLEDFDVKELGRQARAAVEMFQTKGGDFDEEPTEEMLAQLESEMAINGDFFNELEEDAVDLSKMTVVQLKDECRRRGLKVGGKKADLIDRLQTSSE